ncbi:hypothetical protein BGZ60DRAFT_266423 [Tricladium varicosporioides]|nr:hypothetical protein BGZ60DRAFT_266423 [Hymenoscyphus varicosporioides]
MASFQQYILFCFFCFSVGGAAHPGFGLGIVLGMGGTMFGVGVFALTIGVILTTVYMERSQSLPPRHTQSFQPLEVQVDMPEPLEADTGDEQHIGEPQGLLVTELPIPSSLQLLSSEGPVIERNASPSASSALRSNIFTTTLGSETSSLTSMDDTRTIITDKIEGRQDKQEDPNGPTPAEQLLSHVTGGSTEIEIKPWMQHPKPLMKRTHSNGIGQRGRTNSDDGRFFHQAPSDTNLLTV